MILMLLLTSSLPVSAQESVGTRRVVAAELRGPIGVATPLQLGSAINRARAEDAGLLVIQLDTPGGLVSATRDVIQAILASPVPIVVYVAPPGARAASAGTYITIAAHVAAMAPGTHIGAATPILLGGPPAPLRRGTEQRDASEGTTSPEERKALNDAVAYLRTLAQLRGRNAEWSVQAVREGATLTAAEAKREHVVDILAPDMPSLLAQLDGRSVTVDGVERRLATTGAVVIELHPDWRVRLIAVLTDPNVAFLLMMLGVYGILFELWSPGAVAPGVFGAICLLLGLAALSVLPVNFAGLGLLLLGIALMVAEAFAPGFGVLGIGGLLAFVAGALFLFDPSGADFDIAVAWPVIAGAAVTSLGLFAFGLGFAMRVRRRAPATGSEAMIGAVGHVIDWRGAEGTLRIRGEVWEARGERSFAAGDRARVTRRDGLILHIEPE